MHEESVISNGMKIGFFDSGIGGFTILSAVRKQLPHYDYIYYGDTLNVPYGDRTEEEVFALTLAGVETLFAHGSKLAIVACNTASAETVRKLQDALIPHVYEGRKILGVIIPTVETIMVAAPNHVLLIGTQRTVASKKYERELSERNFSGQFESIATPELVPLLERHEFENALKYLDGVIGGRVGHGEALVLGCTHYVLLKEHLRNRYPRLNVISQDEIIPEKISAYLRKHTEIESKLTHNSSLEIILTKDDSEYRAKLETFVV